jgi:hypothetical protein
MLSGLIAYMLGVYLLKMKYLCTPPHLMIIQNHSKCNTCIKVAKIGLSGKIEWLDCDASKSCRLLNCSEMN